MYASIEISMYPLRPDYAGPITRFIHRLREHPEVEVRTNSMSTRLFGPFELLMQVLTRELKPVMDDAEKNVVVFKLINDDLREEPRI